MPKVPKAPSQPKASRGPTPDHEAAGPTRLVVISDWIGGKTKGSQVLSAEPDLPNASIEDHLSGGCFPLKEPVPYLIRENGVVREGFKDSKHSAQGKPLAL